MKNKLLSFFFTSLFMPLFSSAQEVEMADTFRSDGKIFVVITVMAVILTGLFIYLFTIGKKVSNLEKKLGERK